MEMQEPFIHCNLLVALASISEKEEPITGEEFSYRQQDGFQTR